MSQYRHTAAAIDNLCTIFAGAVLTQDVYKRSLESLVRLAITEYATEPFKAARADMARIDEIIAKSKPAQ